VYGDEPQGRTVRILSIDGGGARGLVPAIVLAEIEARTGRHIADLFDIVAGASTGSVLALGLAVPSDRTGVPRWQAADGHELYRTHLPQIFGRSAWQALAGMGSVLREKYDEEPLEHVLARYFGDWRLSDALTNVIIPAYDLMSGDVLLFDSEQAKADSALDLPMRTVVRGATAAPTYFEPELIGPTQTVHEHLVVDGGIFANNPAMCAFVQAQRRFRGSDLIMVSLGTGAASPSLRLEEVRSWGLAYWARPLLNLVLAGASQATDYQLRSLLGDERYFRFEADLELYGCSHRFDDVSEGNLAALEKAARALVGAKAAEIDRVCELLAR
jgi:patatin-like phospholipase/acyl hydrolase